MKNNIFILLLILSCNAIQAINTYLITNGSLPITIDQPGQYMMVENVQYAATNQTPAISITANNVQLNLLNFTLQQTTGVLSVTGIQVAAGLSNVNIINGNIINFSASAIGVLAGCSQVLVNNITVTGCGQRGIEFIGTVASPILENLVSNCVVLNTCTVANADNVITFSNTYDTIFSNCVTASCGSLLASSTLSMIKVVNGFRHKYQNIAVINNSGQFDLRGYSFSNTQSCIFTDCLVNGMVAGGGGSNCQGFVLESNSIGLTGSSIANRFNGCLVSALTGTRNVDGFLTDSGNYDNNFFNCNVQNLQVLDVAGVLSGFRFVNNRGCHVFNCSVLSCTASRNNTTAAPLYAAYGLKFDTVINISTSRCTIADIWAAPLGRSVGLFWINTQGSTAFQNEVSRCFVCYDQNATQAAGITSNAVIQCLAQKASNATYANMAANSIANTNPQTLNGAANGFPWINMGIN
jgi:hypothetical protein